VTIAEAGNCAPEDLGGESFCRVSYTGNELEGAARNSAVARLDIRMPFVRDLDWFAGAQGTYRDKRYISDSNIAQLDSYFELDAQVGVGGDNWEAVIYVENMLDDDTPRSSLATAAPLSPPNATTPPREQAIPQLQVVSLNKPQLFGARFNIRF